MNPSLFRAALRMHLPLHQTIRRVEQQQWLSRSELEELALERQKALVRHAYMHSPFYRRKYDTAGFNPDSLRDPDDFSRIPILTKGEVREHLTEIVCDGISRKRLRPQHTGGSTGVPLMIYHDGMEEHLMYALNLRTIAAWGLEPGYRAAIIWRTLPSNLDYLYTKQSLRERLLRFLKNYVLLDACDMSFQMMAGFAEVLRKFNPDLIIGMTGATAAFAHFLDERGGAGFRPRAISLSAERTQDFQKELIERVFRSNAYDQYGSVEINFHAAECMERDGLHINVDFRTLEVVDENGQLAPAGQMGQVVITDLVNYAAPLIRYENEDLASLCDGTCPCGRGLPLMSKVMGRIYDMFVLPDGSQVYPHCFNRFFHDHVDEVREFQVHQTRTDRATVRIVPTATCQREVLTRQILQAFSKYTGGQVKFEIYFVENIEKEASGKFHFVRSDVRNPATRSCFHPIGNLTKG